MVIFFYRTIIQDSVHILPSLNAAAEKFGSYFVYQYKNLGLPAGQSQGFLFQMWPEFMYVRGMFYSPVYWWHLLHQPAIIRNEEIIYYFFKALNQVCYSSEGEVLHHLEYLSSRLESNSSVGL